MGVPHRIYTPLHTDFRNTLRTILTMPTHHPGTAVAHSKGDIDPTDVPWAVTTHLLAINHQQLLRVTRHPFLERAAKGTLPKPLIAQWLANDRQYIEGYLSTLKNTL